MIAFRTRFGLLAIFCLGVAATVVVYLGLISPSAPQESTVGTIGSGWVGPDEDYLPFETDDGIADFLRTADVVSSKRIGEGINNPLKVVLEKDGVRMHAVFRDVKVYKRKVQLGNRTHFDFRDDARFEIAAYQMGRMLGLDNIPPAVERKVKGKKGSLQLWLEGAVTEKKRIEKGLKPEDEKLWHLQSQVRKVFDNLIYNDDRNQGNMVYDSDWKLYLIDHTRAFRTHKQLPSPNIVLRCERNLFERLKQLDEQEVKEKLGDYLSGSQMRGLMKRRDLLVERLQGRIDKVGEEQVLFEYPADWERRQGSRATR